MTAGIELLGPGVHELTDDEYFAPALARATLSSTGARELLKPGGPAPFRHRADAGTVEVKRQYDVGHAVHSLTLGAGPEVVLFPGTGKNPEAWQTNADKEAVAAMRADGKVPLRPKDYAAAHAMRDSIWKHRIACNLLAEILPERTLFWYEDGLLCRAKVDGLHPGGLVDLKTADAADAESISKAAYNHGYAIQEPFYLRGFRALRPGVDPFFAFITVEKEPPYLVHVTQLVDRAVSWGDRQVTKALEIYRACIESGEWPGYPTDEITDIDIPAWVRTEEY